MSGYTNSLDAPTKMGDLFTDLQSMGQEVIDAGAEAVGIEKGGDLDTAITTAAGIGRNVTGITSIDKAISTITGGNKTGTSTTTTAAGSTTSGSGFFKSISPTWAAGGAVVGGVGLHFAFKRWWATILGGLGLGLVTGIVGPKIVKP